MNEPTIRKWHRYIAVGIAPLVFLQFLSGLFLSFEWLNGLHTAAGQLLPDASPLLQFWDWAAIGVHYGGGKSGAVYHTLLGIGGLWLTVSGLLIYFKRQARMRKR